MRHASRDQKTSRATLITGRHSASTASSRRAFAAGFRKPSNFNLPQHPPRARNLSMISRLLPINRSQFLARPSQNSHLRLFNPIQFLAADWHRPLAQRLTRFYLAAAFDLKGSRDQPSTERGTLQTPVRLPTQSQQHIFLYIFIHSITFYTFLRRPSSAIISLPPFGESHCSQSLAAPPILSAVPNPFQWLWNPALDQYPALNLINSLTCAFPASHILNLYQCFSPDTHLPAISIFINVLDPSSQTHFASPVLRQCRPADV
jgi:hypothetical protein